jgi:uncharacterized protein (TIGR00369 family)
VAPSRADQFAPLDPAVERRWMRFATGERVLFPMLVGLVVEAVRVDYCRMRMPFRADLQQAGGVVHGGALATLLDSVVVPAVGSTLVPDARFATVDMHVQYLGALVDDDAVAEGWVVKRGRTTAFCESEARAASTGRLVARSLLTYHVAPPA